MQHTMRLWESSFHSVKSGIKTIEIRLFDEKRALLNCGDTIVFENSKTGEKISCLIKNIYKYATFEELYANHEKTALGYRADEEASPNDMLAYYTQAEIDKYGVVGIEIEKIK